MRAAGGGFLQPDAPSIAPDTPPDNQDGPIASKPSQKDSGNKCGHNPDAPRFEWFSVKGKKKASQVQKLIDGFERYYFNPFLLPLLANLQGGVNKDGTPSQNRSDGREAEALVGKAILGFTEFASLRVGTPQANGDFINRSCRELAKQCGLSSEPTDADIKNKRLPKPSQRFWRAFGRLRDAGMFTVSRQYEVVGRDAKGKAIKRGRSAIKCLSEDFLVALNVLDYKRLATYRQHCSDTLKAAADIHAFKVHRSTDAEHARNRLKFKKDGAKIKTPASPRDAAHELKELKEQYQRQATRKMVELKKAQTPSLKINKIIIATLGTLDNYLEKHFKPQPS